MNYKSLIYILMALMLSGCFKTKTPEETKERQDYINSQYRAEFIKYANTEIQYVRDNRTGICFAIGAPGDGRTMTTVPCSKEVQALIKDLK